MAARADLKEKREARRHHSKIYEAWEGNFKKSHYFINVVTLQKKSIMASRNPLSFLGLRKRDEPENEEETEVNNSDSPKMSKGGLELNRRGVPARKRKLNSLIYGVDDLVSIPVKSPKKRGSNIKTPTKTNGTVPVVAAAAAIVEDNNSDAIGRVLDSDDDQSLPPSSPVKETKTVSKSAPTSPTKSPKKKIIKTKIPRTPKSSKKEKVKADAIDPELTSPEKISAQLLGVALRNLLKLPKGHKWVCYEFFYSNLDQVLFEGENDFMVCMKESFPQLKTRRLSRVEWCKVRRLMGKPRRCSSAFFTEERAELARKRQKIRMLQQRKQLMDYTSFKDLPEHIPLLLTIGARVTARYADQCVCGL